MKKNIIYSKKIIAASRAILMATTLVAFSPSYSHEGNEPTEYAQKIQGKEAIKAIEKLTQYEIDESFLLTQCIENVKDPGIKAKLALIKKDVEKNLNVLTKLGQKYGAEPIEHSKDFKGYFMNGYTAMRGIFTDKGTLNALDTNLNVVLNAFESALKSTLPEEVRNDIQKMCAVKKKTIQDISALI